MINRTLITSSCFVRDYHSQILLELWARLLVKQNPDVDILLVDSGSPVDVGEILAPWGFRPVPEGGGALGEGRWVLRLSEQWGDHHNEGGRAVKLGLQIAVLEGYDWAVYIEGDTLFAPPIEPLVSKLDRLGVSVSAPFEHTFQYMETSIVFYRVNHLIETGFIDTYDWRHGEVLEFDELRREKAHKDELVWLPVRGGRADDGRIHPGNIHGLFPHGIDWITHAHHMATYFDFLQINKIRL